MDSEVGVTLDKSFGGKVITRFLALRENKTHFEKIKNRKTIKVSNIIYFLFLGNQDDFHGYSAIVLEKTVL